MSDVEVAKTALREVASTAALDALMHPDAPPEDLAIATAIEASSDAGNGLVGGVRFHAGMAAVHLAFRDHRPLTLSPDIVWLFLAQGFADHVNTNAEALRSRFVAHEGQLDLAVRRDDLIKGATDNPWPEVLDAFAREIRRHIGTTTDDLLRPEFSTTGPVERAAVQIVLLDAMQSYFTYEVDTLCGIPHVLLEGTPEDWQALARHARDLARFGLEQWTHLLEPILGEFVNAARGRPDPSFWQSIYKSHNQSGGPYVSGWINAFFPYLRKRVAGRDSVPSKWMAEKQPDWRALIEWRAAGGFQCPTTENFPSGLARAPFVWDYLGDRSEMELVAGFTGVRQDAGTLALRPQIGWAIHEPARSNAVAASRVAEDKARREAAHARAVERSKQWVRRGMCPRCQFWRYLFAQDQAVCCGVPLVNVEERV